MKKIFIIKRLSMNELSKELQIISFLNEIEWLKSTLRHNWSKWWRQESVAEHSWRLTIMLILIQEINNYEIDLLKTIKIILIHDIWEVNIWDTPWFIKAKMITEDYKECVFNETQNAKRVFSLLPKPLDIEYCNLFLEYEEATTKEAKLAKALDKIETNLQHLESWPDYWSDEERGEHMLNYPNKALNQLNETFVENLWQIIKQELEKIT